MELFLSLVILLEIFEIFWQRGNNLKEYIRSLYYFYSKNLLLFILLHPSFYYYIFLQIYFNNYSLIATSMTLLKGIDIAFKLSLLYKIEQNQDLGLYKIV